MTTTFHDNRCASLDGKGICNCECYTVKIEDSRFDPVNKPKGYNSHPSGVECITIVEHMTYNVGCAVKYLWRYLEKGSPIQDLEKAKKYIEFEIARLERE